MIKRHILTIVMLLVLGTIVSVLLAWAIWARPMPTGGVLWVLEAGPSEMRWWRENAPPSFAQQPTGWVGEVEQRAFGRCVTSLDFDSPNTVTPRIRNTVMRIRAGWPMLSMEGSTWTDPLRRKGSRHYLYYPPSGWPCSKWGIPYRPLWLGVATNTVVMAFILWLLLLGRLAVRRIVRIKRGLCPACAYPVGSNAICTECGKPLRHRTAKVAT